MKMNNLYEKLQKKKNEIERMVELQADLRYFRILKANNREFWEAFEKVKLFTVSSP